MKLTKTLKNWRWWVMMLTWFPLVLPFATIVFMLSIIGAVLEAFGRWLHEFSTYTIGSALTFVARTKQIRKWVYMSDFNKNNRNS